MGMCPWHAKMKMRRHVEHTSPPTHTHLSPPTLRELLENTLVPLPSLLVDTNHLAPVTRPQNLAGRGDMRWCHHALHGGIRDIWPTLSTEVAILAALSGNGPRGVAGWKATAWGLWRRKRKTWKTILMVPRDGRNLRKERTQNCDDKQKPSLSQAQGTVSFEHQLYTEISSKRN